MPHGHKCISNGDSYLAGQVIVTTSGKTECIVVCRPWLTAGWHLYGGDDLDAFQHCRDQRRCDPIIAEAALASDSQKPRGALVSRAAAIAEARGAVTGWALLEAISPEAVKDYQPYWAVAAHLLTGLERPAEAAAAYSRAIGLCQDPAMREFLRRRMIASFAPADRRIVRSWRQHGSSLGAALP